MSKIMAFAEKRGIAVIEDCAQSFLAEENGKRVGTFGAIGCFSLQQGKHITCGEGGLVATNSDELARQVRLYVNKAWGYGDPTPDHYFLALNYRMTELQAPSRWRSSTSSRAACCAASRWRSAWTASSRGWARSRYLASLRATGTSTGATR